MMKWSAKEKIIVRRALREMERMASAGESYLDWVPHPLSGQFDATPANAVRGWINGCAELWEVNLGPMTSVQEAREAARAAAGIGRSRSRGIGR